MRTKMTGIEKIAAAFANSGKRAALMPYLMGGFPDLETSRRIGEAYIDGGADLIELGVPFSDPLADGPVIHAAGTKALERGVTVEQVLDVGGTLGERVPVLVMCYANPIYRRGLESFADALAERGIAGLIVPDLPLEEAPAVQAALDERRLALVPLVAPTTPDERLRTIGARARGFLYTVSLTGTTGERRALDGELRDVIARAAASTEVPVAVGFGIATPEHAAQAAAAGAHGVIVGSRLVREAAEADDPAAAVERVVRGLADALR
jgi:tryptophan synthase alpha chain